VGSSSVDLIPLESKAPVTSLEAPHHLSIDRIACGYHDGGICVWDPATQTQTRHQVLHTGPLSALSFSPKNPRLLATGGADGRLTLLDITSRSARDPNATVPVGDNISALCFHEDAIHTLVGTVSGYILLFDWRNIKRPVCKVPEHVPFPVNALSFQV